MKKIWTMIKEIFKYIGLAIASAVAGILVFLHIRSKYEKDNDTRSYDDIVESVKRDRTSEFRDRSGDVLRGIFSDRGHRSRPGDSGGGDRAGSGSDSPRVQTGTGAERSDHKPSGNSNNDIPERDNMSGDNSRGTDLNTDNPIEVSDEGFLNHMQGAVIRRNGQKLLCLLAPLQYIQRKLTAEEIIEIYEQGRKDPAIMDRKCNMGNKGYLVTYHAKRILGLDRHLVRVNSTQKYDFVIKEYRKKDTSTYGLYDHTGVNIFPSEWEEQGGLGTVHYYKWS